MIEGDQGKWLLAKARQLKERALSTADRTRRKQFLLIATEYQKLALLDTAASETSLNKVVSPANTSEEPLRGEIAQLRPEIFSPVLARSEAHIEKSGLAEQSARLRHVVILAVVTLVAFALVLIPGDQTEGGLHSIFDAFFN